MKPTTLTLPLFTPTSSIPGSIQESLIPDILSSLLASLTPISIIIAPPPSTTYSTTHIEITSRLAPTTRTLSVFLTSETVGLSPKIDPDATAPGATTIQTSNPHPTSIMSGAVQGRNIPWIFRLLGMVSLVGRGVQAMSYDGGISLTPPFSSSADPAIHPSLSTLTPHVPINTCFEGDINCGAPSPGSHSDISHSTPHTITPTTVKTSPDLTIDPVLTLVPVDVPEVITITASADPIITIILTSITDAAPPSTRTGPAITTVTSPPPPPPLISPAPAPVPDVTSATTSSTKSKPKQTTWDSADLPAIIHASSAASRPSALLLFSACPFRWLLNPFAVASSSISALGAGSGIPSEEPGEPRLKVAEADIQGNVKKSMIFFSLLVLVVSIAYAVSGGLKSASLSSDEDGGEAVAEDLGIADGGNRGAEGEKEQGNEGGGSWREVGNGGFETGC